LKLFIIPTIIGFLALNEEETLIDFEFFPKDVESVSCNLKKIKIGSMSGSLRDLIKRCKKPDVLFVFEDEKLAKSVYKELKIRTKIEKASHEARKVRDQLGKIAVEYGFMSSLDEFKKHRERVAFYLAREQMKTALSRADLFLVNAIHTYDELDRSINLYTNKIREWYGIHFPELDNLVSDHEIYLKLVAEIGERTNFSQSNLKDFESRLKNVEQIEINALESIGSSASDNDIQIISQIASRVLLFHEIKESLEKYIEEVMEQISPNIKELVGAKLGARIIASAGGLMKLATKPSSTIQILGAEKALYRSIRTGSRPPKHGFIFQHPQVHGSPKRLRGKIARAIAGKIAIAARIDAYGGEFQGEILKNKLDTRINEILGAPKEV
jgi:nucleolar protein 56